MDTQNKLNIDLDSADEKYPVLDDKYILVKKIGSGATCKVKLALEKETNEIVAVKLLNGTGGKSINTNSKHYNAEIDMLKKINHTNIINLRDGNRGLIKKPDGRSKMADYIVLDYAENCELFDYLYFPKKGFGEKMARHLFKQLIEGIDACHKSGVAHRDLKTENLMMNGEWTLKIADFGYATLLAGKSGNGILTTPLGTLSYAAPEILNKKPYVGSSADLFSCGVILFILVTGKLPFGKAVVFDSYYKNFIRNEYESFWTIMASKIGTVSDEFKSIINSLLAYDPTQRPTVAELKKHDWMSMEYPTKDEVVAEFEERKIIVTKLKALEQEEEEKQKKKNKTGHVYRSDDDDESDSYEDLIKDERTVEEYIESNNPYKVKVKHTDALKVINSIARYFRDIDTKAKQLKPNENYAKFRVDYEIDSEITENMPDLEVENLALEVEVKKLDDDYFVAEFSKVSGDKYEFFNIYDEYVSSINVN